ncbi:MAG: hypothetical protein NW237_11960 [Cyanobacteriota bacterium]|nr:hypothetical protein [Cyanobacteriota bacterium]
MRLGKVVKSNNHCDYVVEVDDRLSVKSPPAADDYGFGCFVRLDTHNRHWGVGVIYNTQLFNPAFLNSGPRLSSQPNPIYSPDLQNEIKTLLAVVLIGSLQEKILPARPDSQTKPTLKSESSSKPRPDSSPSPSATTYYGYQGIPKAVVPIDTLVYRMTSQEIHQFHQNIEGKSQFTYYGLLLNCGGIFSSHLIQQVLNEISEMFEGSQRRAIETLSKELSWKMTMGAMR